MNSDPMKRRMDPELLTQDVLAFLTFHIWLEACDTVNYTILQKKK